MTVEQGSIYFKTNICLKYGENSLFMMRGIIMISYSFFVSFSLLLIAGGFALVALAIICIGFIGLFFWVQAIMYIACGEQVHMKNLFDMILIIIFIDMIGCTAAIL